MIRQVTFGFLISMMSSCLQIQDPLRCRSLAQIIIHPVWCLPTENAGSALVVFSARCVR